MKRALFPLANPLGGVVIVLPLIDPARPLAPVFILLALAVVFAILPRFLPWWPKRGEAAHRLAGDPRGSEPISA
jgi:hypothetical protein